MSYVALYRAYRPKDFTEVAGQEVIVKTLRNAIKNDKIGHAYIFSGTRGTGKTSLAKIFAKAVNCMSPNDGNPCNQCPSCNSANSNQSVDIIEIDGASNNGVDEIRELRDKVKYLPSIGKYKVYIIDEVHMLTQGAFNALLKTLEEPPRHVIFILATTEIHKVPATIISRCQRYEFKNISIEAITKRINEIALIEKVNIEQDAVKSIAFNAKGGLRDALSLLDQAISYTKDLITVDDINDIIGSVSKEEILEIFKSIVKKDIAKALDLISSFLNRGKEETKIISEFIYVLRDLLLVKVGYLKDDKLEKVKDDFSTNKVYHYLDVLIKIQEDMKFSYQKRMYLEIAVIKMIEHDDIVNIDLQDSINRLKKELDELKKTGIKKQGRKEIDKIALVNTSDIEEVLYEANLEVKNTLNDSIKTNKNVKSYLELYDYLLKKCEVVAASNSSAILTSVSIDDCTTLMQEENRVHVLELLKNENTKIDKYVVIENSDWQIVRKKYVDLYNLGQKRPKIGEYDFKIYQLPKKEKNDIINDEIVKLAHEYFGKDIVEIKE